MRNPKAELKETESQVTINMQPGRSYFKLAFGSDRRSEDIVHFSSGRIALGYLLRQKVAGSTILVPAYHCKVIRDACVWAGCNIAYYKVDRGLEPDRDHIEELVVRHRPGAVLIIHYFGRLYETEWLSDLCVSSGALLVHDCAHVDTQESSAFEIMRNLNGFTISSPRKFYPVYDGGFLIGVGNLTATPQVRILDELRALKWQAGLFFNAVRRGGSVPINVQQTTSSRSGVDEVERGAAIDRFGDFDDTFRMSLCSRLVVSLSDVARIHRMRMSNYLRISEFITSHCRHISVLTHDVKHAYCVTAIVDKPDIHYELRGRGIKCWRWESMPNELCSTTDYFSRHLIQIPCHQGLGAREVQSIFAVLEGY